MENRNLLIVFDIDETLIQYVSNKSYHYWQAITPEQKKKLEEKIDYLEIKTIKKNEVIFFRPGLREFLEMARDSGRIKVALWTYAETEYAEEMAKIICEKFELPQDTFLFKYGDGQIKDHDIPKSLKQVWDDDTFGHQFNKFNTFLVDDRYGNLAHKINKNNGILVQAFAPFGETKAREPLTDKLLQKATEDTIFKELTDITKKLLKDMDGCSDEEIQEALPTESVFAPKCMKRKGLEHYVKKYEKNIELITIGDVEHAASAFKGGKKRRTRKTRKSRSRKSRSRKSRSRKSRSRKSFRKYKR
jgi:hypothetical protein